ncbi:MAG TPA: cytochrome c oxidase assembly protein, partial [Solirubrobacteraceae bacterium]|nr:cytochrome c oxidase assembly protein [Solirubrobacteraceae bacterium]
MSGVPGWGSWSLNPVVIVALVAAAVVYRRVYLRAAARSSNSAPGAGHWVPYSAGLVVLAIALLSPLDAIGDKYLLSAHMMQHVLLSDIAPALLVLGLRAPVLPLGLSREAMLALAPSARSGKLIARLTSPWVAVPLWALATWIWAIPVVFDFAAQHSVVHAIE